MYKFLETYNLPILSHEETEKLKRPITIRVSSQTLPINKYPGPGDFTSEFNQILEG